MATWTAAPGDAAPVRWPPESTSIRTRSGCRTPATAAPSRSAPPDGVDADGEVGQLEEGPETGRLGAFRPQRIGEKQVAQARRREHLGLAQRAHGQPRRTGLELHPGDSDALVGLDVRPERDPAGVEVSLEALDVGHHAVHEHDQPGRVDAGGQVRERNRRNWRLGHATEHTQASPERG